MLKVGFIIPLIIMNVLLLIIVIDFWKNCRSKAAKVGFGIMLTVYVPVSYTHLTLPTKLEV